MTDTTNTYSNSNYELSDNEALEIIYKYHKNYNGFNTIDDRGKEIYDYCNLKYFDFNKYEINNLVLYWQKTQNKIVRDAIFETYMIFYKKMLPKYLAVSHTLRKDSNSYELDMFQDFILILNKCMSEYENVENASFKSYAHNWFQFTLGEGIRTKYFSLLVFPQHIIKQQRKKTKLLNKSKNQEELNEEEQDFIKQFQDVDYNFVRNELDEGIAVVEVEETILANVFDKKIIEIIKKYIDTGRIKITYLDWFLRKHGIFSREYRQTELADMYKVSNSTISKGIKTVRTILSQNSDLQKIYYGE